MSEQNSIYDLAPNIDLKGWFTCGSCRCRCHPSKFGSWRGRRGGGKWAQCRKCLKMEEKTKRLIKRLQKKLKNAN